MAKVKPKGLLRLLGFITACFWLLWPQAMHAATVLPPTALIVDDLSPQFQRFGPSAHWRAVIVPDSTAYYASGMIWTANTMAPLFRGILARRNGNGERLKRRFAGIRCLKMHHERIDVPYFWTVTAGGHFCRAVNLCCTCEGRLCVQDEPGKGRENLERGAT